MTDEKQRPDGWVVCGCSGDAAMEYPTGQTTIFQNKPDAEESLEAIKCVDDACWEWRIRPVKLVFLDEEPAKDEP